MKSPYDNFPSSILYGCIIALPNCRYGISPLDLLTRKKVNHRDLRRSHVWEYSVFVLEPNLQNDQNILKWNHRGFSEHQSSLILNVHYLKTYHISPQYHIVFDNLFENVYIKGENYPKADAISKNLFYHKCNWYVLEEYDEERNLVYKYIPLHEVWLADPES